MIPRIFPTGLLGTLLLLGSCGGGNFDLADLVKPPANAVPAGPAGVTQLKGEVKDPEGRAVAGAAVTLRRSASITTTTSATTTTDAEGRFTFTSPTADLESTVTIEKAGYATNAKGVPVSTGKTTTITLRLFPDQLSRTFAAAAGSTLTFGGATVVIPPNALRTPPSTPYTGSVQASASYFSPDTLTGVQAFPAGYRSLSPSGRDADRPLVSLGVIELKLRDAAGQALALQPDVQLTLTFPATRRDTVAASVSLSRYDAPNAGWSNQTVAARQPDSSLLANTAESGTALPGPLIWTVHLAANRAQISGCSRDAGGQPVADVGVFGLRTTGWESPPKVAATDGAFTFVQVAADVPLELYSLEQPPSFASVAIPAVATTTSASPAAPRQLPCITVKARPTGSVWTLALPTTQFTAP